MSTAIKVKVCGLRQAENILDVAKLAPDYLGFIFYSKSPRFVSDQTIPVETSIQAIGVFVNESLDFIREKIHKFNLSGVQLHGEESPEFCSKLKALYPEIFLIKAFHAVKGLNDVVLAPYQASADYFLFDTPSDKYGGTGLTFDWEIIKKINHKKPFFLSGGIDAANASDAISACENLPLYAIDINSRVEDAPAIKNVSKVKAVIELVHKKSIRFEVDSKGYFGSFGGAFIPEMLYPNIKELKERYLEIIRSRAFQEEYRRLLNEFVGRPTALYFAERLSKDVGFNVLLKREDLNHTGSHKINNAIGQVLLARKLGKTRIIAETGAGQHGVATATASALFGLDCTVYMGEIDIARQAPNVARMKMLGTKVVPVTSGSKVLKDAVNEAMRDWISNPTDTHYVIGSVVGPHPFPDMVARFQSIIGEEVKLQSSVTPNAVIACVGGGSNAIGIFRAFINDPSVRLIGVEAAGEGIGTNRTAASITSGKAGIFHGARTLLLQDSDGQVMEAHSISAGLDYPGIGPEHAFLHTVGRVEYLDATDSEALEAAKWLIKSEGIIPALESAHALVALKKIKASANDTVVVCLSGRGDKDMAIYEKIN